MEEGKEKREGVNFAYKKSGGRKDVSGGT